MRRSPAISPDCTPIRRDKGASRQPAQAIIIRMRNVVGSIRGPIVSREAPMTRKLLMSRCPGSYRRISGASPAPACSKPTSILPPPIIHPSSTVKLTSEDSDPEPDPEAGDEGVDMMDIFPGRRTLLPSRQPTSSPRICPPHV